MKYYFATTVALLTLHSLPDDAIAAEVTWSGAVDADAIRTYGNSIGDESNHEISLGAHVNFTDQVSLDLGIATANGFTPDGDGAPEGRWSELRFDGVMLNVQLREQLSIHGGDMVYTEGAFQYFAYRSTGTYSAGFCDSHLRGGAVRWNGFELAAGMSDVSSGLTNGYASYSLNWGDYVWKPYGYVQIGEAIDTLTRVAGLALSAEWGAQSLHANASYLQEKAMSPSYTFLAEPHLQWGEFILDVSAFYALRSAESTPIGVADRWFAYAEPQIQLHPEFSVGLSAEIHDYVATEANTIRTLLMGHYKPQEQVNLLLFAGPNWVGSKRSWQLGGGIQGEF